MKLKINYVLFLLLPLAVCLLFGCKSVDKRLYKEEVRPNPNYSKSLESPQTQTNAEKVLAVFPNHAPALATTVPALITNLVANPKIEAAIEGISVLPIPYAGAVGGLFALLYSTYRNIRNKKNVESLVLGVEAVRGLIKETPELQHIDQKVIKILKNNQKSLGTINDISKVVAKLTDKRDSTIQHLD